MARRRHAHRSGLDLCRAIKSFLRRSAPSRAPRHRFRASVERSVRSACKSEMKPLSRRALRCGRSDPAAAEHARSIPFVEDASLARCNAVLTFDEFDACAVPVARDHARRDCRPHRTNLHGTFNGQGCIDQPVHARQLYCPYTECFARAHDHAASRCIELLNPRNPLQALVPTPGAANHAA